MKRLLLIAAVALSVSGLQAAGLRDLAASTLRALESYADYYSGRDITEHNAIYDPYHFAFNRYVDANFPNSTEVPVNVSTSERDRPLGEVQADAGGAAVEAGSLAQNNASPPIMLFGSRFNWPKTRIAGRSLASLGRAAVWGVAAQQTLDKKSWFRKLLNKKIANRHLRRLALLSPALLALLADAAIAAPTQQHSVLGAAGRGLRRAFCGVLPRYAAPVGASNS